MRRNIVILMLALLGSTIVWGVHAQAPAEVKAAPIVHRLSPAQSQDLLEIEQAEFAIRVQWDALQKRRRSFFVGAEIPVDAKCVIDKDVYVCTIPPATKPSPQP